jgi:hypothetical protein
MGVGSKSKMVSNVPGSPTVSEKVTAGTDKAYALQKMLHQTPTRYLDVP